jgi:YegS/Rv2252/BmrU family lipid kinase
MKMLLLVNPKAGTGRRGASVAERARTSFPGWEVEAIVPGSREHLHEAARRGSEGGVDLVVAVGGDGTVREVARALAGTPTALGVIPFGSGNGFARGLGIGLSAAKALEGLAKGRDRTIDVGLMNGEPFFNVSGIGFDAVVGEGFDRSRVRGILPYFRIAARESLQYRPVEVDLRLGDREIVARVFLVTVANLSQFGAGAVIAPDADPEDGLLDIIVVRRLSAFELLIHAPKLFDGSVRDLSSLETYRSSSFRIVRSQGGPLHLDGEPVRAGHVLDYRVLPRALRVRVPA